MHYCWLILLSCCLLQGAGLGIVNNCSGLFYEPVARNMGFSIGSISLYSSISIIVSCVVMLFITQLLERFKTRVILTIGALCTSAPMLLMSFCRELWQWYALAVFQGFGLAFTTNLVAPIILNNWFHERLGMALGLSVSAGGIFGAIMSTVLGKILCNGSWRTAYMVAGLTGLAMTIPVCLFVLRMHPEEMGLRPYGERREETPVFQHEHADISYKELLRDVRLWKILSLMALARCNIAFMPHLTSYGKSINFTVMDTSVFTTLFMVGNMLSKIAFGSLNDRWGTKKSTYLGLTIILVAELLLLTARNVSLIVGAFMFGTVSMFSQVQITLLCRNTWDGAEYAKTMVALQVVSQVFYSMAITGMGYAYDFLGTYRPMLVFLILTIPVCAMLVWMFFHKKQKNVPG